MKNIIHNLKAILSTNARKTARVDCNYSNNYYGDQVCQARGA
jgi:hypothetical protein